MANYTKANDWAKNLATTSNLATDSFKVALSNTAPASESSNPLADGNGILANITQVSYTYTSSRTLTTASFNQSGGVARLIVNDLTLSSTGGATGPFRYIYVYNDTPTSPADPIVGMWDYGSSTTIPDGGSFPLDFDNTNGMFTVTIA